MHPYITNLSFRPALKCTPFEELDDADLGPCSQADGAHLEMRHATYLSYAPSHRGKLTSENPVCD